MPDGRVLSNDGSGYWEDRSPTKDDHGWGLMWHLIKYVVVPTMIVLALAAWFAYWSKHTGTSQGNVSGSQLPSCIVEFAKNHFQQPANFGVACY